MNKFNILALIPARGGSKSIPRKNIMPLAGKPMIAYSIEHAQKSHHINRIIVTTDDEEIAQISRKWGAEVPFMRPKEFAQDHSPDIDAFRHALQWLDENERYIPDMVVHLRPPGPVRRVDLIDRAIEKLQSEPEADALRSVSVAHQTPFKMWMFNEDGMMSPVASIPGLADSQSIPRQQLPTVYWQNGYIDIIRPRAILEKNSMWGARVLPFIVEDHLFEIDYHEDVPAVEDALRQLEQGLDLPKSESSKRHSI
jgi:CMP-N,N'-diacetyllegionaminic acid synthase